ncbi:MAG: hypothetical protein KKC77_19755, partial [Proteobacteria bacterium]|nr:hypothetical protein [Pseudomonadota bacterium]
MAINGFDPTSAVPFDESSAVAVDFDPSSAVPFDESSAVPFEETPLTPVIDQDTGRAAVGDIQVPEISREQAISQARQRDVTPPEVRTKYYDPQTGGYTAEHKTLEMEPVEVKPMVTDPTVVGKGVVVGGAGLAEAAAYSADYILRKATAPKIKAEDVVGGAAPSMGDSFAPPSATYVSPYSDVGRPKLVSEMTDEEKKKVVTPTIAKRMAGAIDKSVPEKWKKDVGQVQAEGLGGDRIAKDPYGWALTALTQATTNAPLYAEQAVSSLVGNAVLPGFGGVVAGGGAMMATEMGMFLKTAEQMSEGMTDSQKAQWQEITDKYAPVYGVASGLVEYAGNASGALGAFKNQGQKAMQKVLLERIAGIAGEGFEELTQEGLQNLLMGKAIQEMKSKDPGFAPDWKPGSLVESALSGMVVSGILSGVGLGAGKLGKTIAGKKEVEAAPTTDASGTVSIKGEQKPTRQFSVVDESGNVLGSLEDVAGKEAIQNLEKQEQQTPQAPQQV